MGRWLIWFHIAGLWVCVLWMCMMWTTKPTSLGSASKYWLVSVSFIYSFFLSEPPHDKTSKMTVRPAKTQVSLGICPVWSESSLCTQWVAKAPSFLHVDSEDSDQTGRMPRLIWVFAGCTATLLVLSWGGSSIFIHSFLSVYMSMTKPTEYVSSENSNQPWHPGLK